MLHFEVENLRTFSGRHSFPIAPLTIVTGENSSGKSSLLAGLACICDPDGFPLRPSFNRAPYSLGTFETIASRRGSRSPRKFSLGYRYDLPRPGQPHSVTAVYEDVEGRPALGSLVVAIGKDRVSLHVNLDYQRGFAGLIRIKVDDHTTEEEFSVPRQPLEGRVPDLSSLLLSLMWRSKGARKGVAPDLVSRLLRFTMTLSPANAISVAPIRTKPERVYGQPTDLYDPSGNHIPFVLDRLQRVPTGREAKAVLEALERFGAASGMYSRLSVKRLGRKSGAPFQLQATISGRPRNLIDIGYGVSQALPVVVQIALLKARDILLLQQPEVHLHPRAQAALGSLFAVQLAKGRRRFVVETHSDFIIDRVRQEVAAGTLAPEAVRVLFIERNRTRTKVWAMEVDSRGNLLKAPPAYGSFFLEEQMNLLGR